MSTENQPTRARASAVARLAVGIRGQEDALSSGIRSIDAGACCTSRGQASHRAHEAQAFCIRQIP
jgi:hypothetical protein